MTVTFLSFKARNLVEHNSSQVSSSYVSLLSLSFFYSPTFLLK